MMAVDTLTRSEGYKGALDSWLSTKQAGAAKGVLSNPVAQGWNHAHVAAFLFNQQCNDSYVGAFLMNLRAWLDAVDGSPKAWLPSLPDWKSKASNREHIGWSQGKAGHCFLKRCYVVFLALEDRIVGEGEAR
jgi:hypothetical protein